jgi:hypothetical protein
MPKQLRNVLVALLALAAAVSPVVAQDPPPAGPDTLTRSGPATLIRGLPRIGAYAAPFVRFGQIDDQLAVYPGLRVGALLGSSFGIGLSAGLLANEIGLDSIPGKDLALKYGGLEVEVIVGANRIVHPSLRILGGAGLLEAGPLDRPEGDPLADSEKILIVEPGAELTLNLSTFIRLAFGGSYRWVRGVDSPDITNEDLSGWLGSVAIAFIKS